MAQPEGYEQYGSPQLARGPCRRQKQIVLYHYSLSPSVCLSVCLSPSVCLSLHRSFTCSGDALLDVYTDVDDIPSRFMGASGEVNLCGPDLSPLPPYENADPTRDDWRYSSHNLESNVTSGRLVLHFRHLTTVFQESCIFMLSHEYSGKCPMKRSFLINNGLSVLETQPAGSVCVCYMRAPTGFSSPIRNGYRKPLQTSRRTIGFYHRLHLKFYVTSGRPVVKFQERRLRSTTT